MPGLSPVAPAMAAMVAPSSGSVVVDSLAGSCDRRELTAMAAHRQGTTSTALRTVSSKLGSNPLASARERASAANVAAEAPGSLLMPASCQRRIPQAGRGYHDGGDIVVLKEQGGGVVPS